jgi:3-hydroxyisobutyrate dehydrogenase
MQAGVAGFGRMGAAIAARRMELGHQVTVWNRGADKAKTLVEAGWGDNDASARAVVCARK